MPQRSAGALKEDQSERSREGRERTLLEWVGLLRDGKVALAVGVSLGILIGVAATFLQKTEYESQGSVVVSSAKGFLSPENADAYPAITDTTRRLLLTPGVLGPTASAYVASAKDSNTAASRRAEATLSWLRTHLTAKQVSISSIIDVTGTASNQEDATDLTQAATASLEKAVSSGGGTGGITVRVFSSGEAKGKVSPSPARNLLLGGNAGLLIGAIAALALGARRRVLRRPEQIARELGLPLVGWIRGRTRGGVNGYSGLAEVRARLQVGQLGRPPTVLLLTGLASSQAIARVAVDLVHSLLESGLRAVLVDADLATRAATSQLRLADAPGLAESLNGGGGERQALAPAVSGAATLGTVGLNVLPAGKPPGDPALALSGARLRETVDLLRDRYDFIVIAGPGLGRVAEVIPLLEQADSAVLVVPRGIEARRLGQARAIGDLRERFAGTLVVDHEG